MASNPPPSNTDYDMTTAEGAWAYSKAVQEWQKTQPPPPPSRINLTPCKEYPTAPACCQSSGYQFQQQRDIPTEFVPSASGRGMVQRRVRNPETITVGPSGITLAKLTELGFTPGELTVHPQLNTIERITNAANLRNQGLDPFLLYSYRPESMVVPTRRHEGKPDSEVLRTNWFVNADSLPAPLYKGTSGRKSYPPSRSMQREINIDAFIDSASRISSPRSERRPRQRRNATVDLENPFGF